MKGFETIRLLVAWSLVAAAASTFSFATADILSPTLLNQRNIQFGEEPARMGECCQSCGRELEEDSTLSSVEPGKKQHDFESGSTSEEATADNPSAIRILTWAQPKPELEAYLDFYEAAHPEAPKIRIYNVPSLKDLDYEVTSELRQPSTIYDGFVVPPMFLGGMYQQRGGQALAIWTQDDVFGNQTDTETDDPSNDEDPKTNNISWMDDLLPYYRYNVATFDGKIRGLPILAGSQAMLLFRKDYLDDLNLPTPKTWEDWTSIAAEFSKIRQQALPISGGSAKEPVYGACLGLLNEGGCRKRNSLDGKPCESHTMTYLGMMMASMTQYMGNTTGYMMGITEDQDDNGGEKSPMKFGRLDPLFQPTLARILKWMEEQVKHSRPGSLAEDASESMRHFREGRCAWTISMDHDSDVLSDDNIGFVPLPGSHLVLDRTSTSLLNCSESCGRDCHLTGTSALCPYGKNVDAWGRVNNVPFGAMDATVGTVSGLVSLDRQEEVKKFFQFVLSANIGGDDSNQVRRQQPLTYSRLEQSNVPNYANMLRKLTSDPNAAIPFRVPNAFNLLSDLDERVYNYLLEGRYTEEKREQVASAAEQSWDTMIAMFDARHSYKSRFPTSFFYEQSLGVHEPIPASDLYIGWTARGVIWILGGLTCLASVCFAVWVWRYTGERVIRASQPVFLYLICAGTFIMALSVITLGIEDDIASYKFTGASCMASFWLYSLGFAAVISALLSKIYMLGKVLQKPRNEQRIQITKRDILVPFMIIFGIDFIILSIWTITDQLRWVRVPVHNDDLYSLNVVEVSTVGWCMSGHEHLDVAFLLVFNYTILIVALVQSYECRRITTEYTESVWVTIAIATFAQVWVIGLPVVVLMGDNPKSYFIVRSCMVLFTACSVLILIFVPKMSYLYEALREAKQTGSTGKRRKDPKGTIGIRIVQSVYLDSDEIDELQDSVDRAEQRNKKLLDTRERLKETLDEHRYTRKHLNGNCADSKASSSNISVGSNSELGLIIEAKPQNLRHSKLRKSDSFLA